MAGQNCRARQNVGPHFVGPAPDKTPTPAADKMKNNMLLTVTAFNEFEERLRLAPREVWRRASATRPNLGVVRAASAPRTRGEQEPTYPKASGCR